MALAKDVVVIGSGGAGLAAAIACAWQGLDVLVLEKADRFGGATAWSGGNLWVPNNSLAQKAGFEDSMEAARNYLQAVIGSRIDSALVDTFLAQAPRMIDFFNDNTAAQVELQTYFSDAWLECEGARECGRCLTPKPYSGKKLGKAFHKLRDPLAQINAPFGMMIGFDDLDHLKNVKSSFYSAWHILKRLLKLIPDRLLYGRGERLTMGNALVARLLRTALDANVELWCQAPASSLVNQQGRVSGVIAMRNGKPETIQARYGVVLASGGFSASPQMREKFFPCAASHVTLMPDANTGDGIEFATGAGAVLQSDNLNNADWVVISCRTNAKGTTKCLHTVLDLPKPGCIAVNQGGRRFGNEASRQFVNALHESNSVPAFLICDHVFIKKYGLGLVKPGGIGLKKCLADGYIRSAPGLEELATQCGIDRDALKASVDRYNQFAVSGIDEDFGKGNEARDRANGDPQHDPNPCIGSITRPPFYALEIFPGDASSWLGLQIDSGARVLNDRGEAIPGLYACGLDVNSL